MVVRIRLARFGRKHAPFYNIVVMQARSARDSKPMEVLGTRDISMEGKQEVDTDRIGTYDPIPKEPVDGIGKKWKDIKLDSTRAKYWLGVGAQPSDSAWRLLSMAGLLPPRFQPKPLEPLSDLTPTVNKIYEDRRLAIRQEREKKKQAAVPS